MPKNFQWRPGRPPPGIENHSLKKLSVIQNYLNNYFDTVVPNPATDTLNITLVDGFCGGGIYFTGYEEEFGSPILLLKSVEAAETRLNQNRDKPLRINARFIFIDKQPEHIEFLRELLIREGYGSRIGDDIKIICGEFVEELPSVIFQINSQQRVGRSIFILDQFGYKDVPMTAIKSIFNTLTRPEVILTFAIDGLLNYLQEESQSNLILRDFGVDTNFLKEWMSNKSDENLGRLISQRTLMRNLHLNSNAEFFTPFMLWSRGDNRWMMLAHLSRHQAARDQMLQVHWDTQNSFVHFGQGSLFSLGFDDRLLESRDSLFEFSDIDRLSMSGELIEHIPRELASLILDQRIEVRELLNKIGNRTAATNSDFLKALENLAVEGEIEALSASGTPKRRNSKINLNDYLVLPRQPNFYDLFKN